MSDRYERRERSRPFLHGWGVWDTKRNRWINRRIYEYPQWADKKAKELNDKHK